MPATVELPLIIDGRQLPPLSGRMLDVINPATEQIEARVPDAGAEDVDAAVRAARGSFETA